MASVSLPSPRKTSPMWMVESKNRRLHCGLLACTDPASLHVVGDETSSMLQLCSFLILTKTY